jgi:hypothetical protein
MPVVVRVGPYRLFFYSSEGTERIHVHVERDDRAAKFWVEPVTLASSGGFGAAELRKIEALVIEHRQSIINRWHEHFDEE